MANETVEIIRIEFDAAAAIKATQQLTAERDKLVAKGKEIEKAEGKNSEAYIKNAAQIKVLNDQVREQQKVSQNLIKSQTELAGSNQQLKAELSVLTSEYNRLSEAERNTGERGQFLKGRILDLTNTLKANESAVGNNFRNVGNYRDALLGLGGGLGNAARGIAGFNQTLKANPVLAVVAAIQFLGGAFSKLQPVVDAIEVALGSLNAVFDVLIERTKLLFSGDIIGAFRGVGSAISDATSAGAEYARTQQDIEDAQRIQNVTNANAEKQIAILTVQLKDKTKTDQERLAIADQITRIEQANFVKQQAILNQTLKSEEAKVRALIRTKGVQDSVFKSTEQLIDAAQRLGLQDKQFEKLVGAQVALTNAEKESLTITERAEVRRNQINDAAEERRKKAVEAEKARKAKLEEAEKKYNDNIAKLQEEYGLTELQKLEKSFNDKLATITKGGEDEIKLRQQIEKKRDEAVAKFQAEQLAKEQQLADQRDLAVLAILEDSLQNRLKIFEIGFKKERAELEKNGNTAAEIEAIKQSKINKITAEFNTKAITDQIALNDALLQNELAAVDNSVATEQEKARRKAEINLDYVQKQLALAQQLAEADGKLTDQELANIEKLRQALIAAQQSVVKAQTEAPPKTLGELFGTTPEEAEKIEAGIAFAIESLGAITSQINERYQREIDGINSVRDAEIAAVEQSALSEEEKKTKKEQITKQAAQQAYAIQVKQFNAEKALNITTAIINTAQAVLKASAQLGPIGAAIGAAIGIAQIALIASQKPPAPPKFADGVVGLKGPGTERSDSIPAYLSRGESVITADGTRFAQSAYPGLLEFLNTRNRFADGVVNLGQVNTANTADIAGQIRSALSDLQIVTRVTDIEKATRDRNQVRSVGVI